MDPGDSAYDLVKICLGKEVAMTYVLQSARSPKATFTKMIIYECIKGRPCFCL